MSLPLETVDRIFRRLGATYGRQWAAMWDGLDTRDVKSMWGHELSAFAGAGMHRIAWALENLPERAPNAIEFKRLCFQAPAGEEKQLPSPAADPARVQAELAKLGGMRPARNAGNPGHMKDWARSLVARHEAGEKIRPISLRFAQEALGIAQ